MWFSLEFVIIHLYSLTLYFHRSSSVVCYRRVACYPLCRHPPLLHPLIDVSSCQHRTRLNAVSTGLYWTLMYSAALDWTLLSFIELFWTLLDSTELYGPLPSFIELCCTLHAGLWLLSSPGLYWTVLDSDGLLCLAARRVLAGRQFVLEALFVILVKILFTSWQQSKNQLLWQNKKKKIWYLWLLQACNKPVQLDGPPAYLCALCAWPESSTRLGRHIAKAEIIFSVFLHINETWACWIHYDDNDATVDRQCTVVFWGSSFGARPEGIFSVGYFQNLVYSGWFLQSCRP